MLDVDGSGDLRCRPLTVPLPTVPTYPTDPLHLSTHPLTHCNHPTVSTYPTFPLYPLIQQTRCTQPTIPLQLPTAPTHCTYPLHLSTHPLTHYNHPTLSTYPTLHCTHLSNRPPAPNNPPSHCTTLHPRYLFGSLSLPLCLIFTYQLDRLLCDESMIYNKVFAKHPSPSFFIYFLPPPSTHVISE